MILSKSDKNSVSVCQNVLREGKIVIIPTDTVYGFSGLACPFLPLDTDSRIKSVKGRAETKPFIRLIASSSDIKKYTSDKIPESLISLWPGPLTIIVNNKLEGSTTAFRCPGDEWIRKILSGLDFPLYSTSVNRSGFPVLDSEAEIIREFESEVDLIVSDGDKKNALPSTIVSLVDGSIKVLRQGSLVIPL